jgi:hypothetical protein
MADVFVNDIGVPLIARNRRVFSGNNAIEHVSGGAGGGTLIDWAISSSELLEILRSLQVNGDITITNLSGNEGDIPFVDADGTMGLVRPVIGETPSGTINNSNTIFTIANTPVSSSVEVFKNGQRLTETTDYTISGVTITFVVAPYTDTYYTDIIRVNYRYVTYLPAGTTGSGLGATVPSTAMTRGAAASATGFDVKASRVGRTMTVTGKFTSVNNPPAGTVIASLPLASIAPGMTLSTRIRGFANEVSSDVDNRGMYFYVETFDPTTNPFLQVKVSYEFDAGVIEFTLTFNML